jgi:hypothetical protein
MEDAMETDLSPDNLTIPIPARPFAVEMAAMVSSSGKRFSGAGANHRAWGDDRRRAAEDRLPAEDAK